jgi:hypothetical protein
MPSLRVARGRADLTAAPYLRLGAQEWIRAVEKRRAAIGG